LAALRPFLYNRLRLLFRHVEIAKEGMGIEGVLVPDLMARSGQRLELEEWGENYVVSCPYCGDTRERLSIGHRWGYYDERTKNRNWWMIKCYNEDCLSDHAKRMHLADRVYNEAELSYGKANDTLVMTPTLHRSNYAAEIPGPSTLVGDLLPNHPARNYLESRGFDPVEISKLYGVRYCADSARFPKATNRLVMPVWSGGSLVGWQARYIGDRDEWKTTAKYYSAPGMRKSRALYNLDAEALLDRRLVVLMEGPTDVWRYGPQAVAAFGKSVSLPQIELLTRFDTVVILLDGDAQKESERIFDRLKERVRRTVRVVLRPGVDPGSMSRDKLRDAVANALEVKGDDHDERSVKRTRSVHVATTTTTHPPVVSTPRARLHPPSTPPR
jgi:hypothetical protein